MCPNNGISRKAAEVAVFDFFSEKVLNFRNMIEVVDRAKRKVGNDRTLLPALEFRLDQIQAERTRLMGLYQRELIDDGDIKRVKFLNEQRTLIQDEIERAKTTRGIVNVFNASLIKSVRNVGQAVRTIDPKIRKRVVQTLFE